MGCFVVQTFWCEAERKIESSIYAFVFNHIPKPICITTTWMTSHAQMKYHFSTFNSPFFKHARFELSARLHATLHSCVHVFCWYVCMFVRAGLLLMPLFQYTYAIHTSYIYIHTLYSRNHGNLLQFTCTRLLIDLDPQVMTFYFAFFFLSLFLLLQRYLLVLFAPFCFYALCLSVKPVHFFSLSLSRLIFIIKHRQGCINSVVWFKAKYNGLMFATVFLSLSDCTSCKICSRIEIVRSWTSFYWMPLFTRIDIHFYSLLSVSSVPPLSILFFHFTQLYN